MEIFESGVHARAVLEGRRGRIVCILLVCLLVGGCFPYRDTFFEPAAEGGTVKGYACRGNVGPPEIIEFDLDGVRISVETFLPNSSKARDQLMLLITLKIPAEGTVLFRSDELTVSTTGGERNLRPDHVEGFNYNLFREFEQKSRTIELWRSMWGGVYDLYNMKFYLGIGEARAFSFRMPSMLINDKEVSIPPITFTLTSAWQIYPIIPNC